MNAIEHEVEVQVLAAVLRSSDLFDEVCDKLSPDDFGVPAHRDIFAAVLACDASGRTFDALTVADEMQRAGTLGRSGGLEFVKAVAAVTPEVSQLAAYVDIIIDRALRRRMVRAAQEIGQAAFNPQADAKEALDTAQQVMFEIGQDRAEGVPAMPVVVANMLEEMAQARNAKLVGHPTGFTKLDELTGGLRGGQLIIIAARPAMGKSVLASQIARHICEVEDLVVPFYTYEMSQSEVSHRLLSAATQIPLTKLLRGKIPPGMDKAVAREAEKMAALRLELNDRPPQTISGLRSAARRLARRGPLGAIVVDYLQLMSGDGGRRDENRTQEVASISRGLKLLAKELDVPVIALSQLSRTLESRPNKRPVLSDLRESGALEQDANLVMFLYRDHVYDKSAPEEDAELIIAKNRQGPSETIPLDWDGPCVRFTNSNRTLTGPAPAPGAGVPAGGPAGGWQGGFGGGGGNVTRVQVF